MKTLQWKKWLTRSGVGSSRLTGPRRIFAVGALLVIASIALAACGGGDSDTSSNSSASGGGESDEQVTIELWNGQTNISDEDANRIKTEFEAEHPNITINMAPGATGSSSILQKITAALAADETPNISYMFGTNIAQVAQSPQAVDLTEVVKEPGWEFPNLYPAAQQGVTVDGKVMAAPVGMDDVAVIYNKEIFEEAGLPFPKEGWTWDEYRETALKLNDPSKGIYGTAIPGAGGSDTTWYALPMIWQAGGDVLTEDGSEVGWGGEPGLKTLQLLHAMAQTDGSVYVDTSPGYTKMLPLFNSGRVGMYLGDTWQFPGIKEAGLDYDAVQIPAWTKDEPHITQAGVQGWMVFDHGEAENQAAFEFLKWQTAPEQEAMWDATIGLPALGPAAQETSTYQKYVKETPGAQVFNEQLAENTKTAPIITSYEDLMAALGKAMASAMLEPDADLQQLLDQSVEEGNNTLATG